MSQSSKRVGTNETPDPAIVQFPTPDTSVEYSLNDSLAYQLRVTYKCFVEKLQPLLDTYEIPIGTWQFLRVLWDEDGLTQRQIGERIGIVAPTTVEQLKSMQKRGLIERHRSAKDRRKIHVYLTAKGKALKAKLLPFAPDVDKLAVAGLSAGEIGFLRLVLNRIRQNLANAAADDWTAQPKPSAKRPPVMARRRAR